MCAASCADLDQASSANLPIRQSRHSIFGPAIILKVSNNALIYRKIRKKSEHNQLGLHSSLHPNNHKMQFCYLCS